MISSPSSRGWGVPVQRAPADRTVRHFNQIDLSRRWNISRKTQAATRTRARQAKRFMSILRGIGEQGLTGAPVWGPEYVRSPAGAQSLQADPSVWREYCAAGNHPPFRV